MDTLPHIKYSGSTPGADTDEYTLFSTVDAFPNMPNAFRILGLQRFVVRPNNSGAGTLKLYRSSNRGTTWVEDTTVAQPVAASNLNTFDFYVADASDFKVTWTNSAASAQTTWELDMHATCERSVAN